jgi:hypothetical protein
MHIRGCRGRDHMVVGFTTTCAISAYRYIVSVSFIGGGNLSTRRKLLICHKSLTNFIT